MTVQNIEPNEFSLHGVGKTNKDVHISYSTTSITGKPLFSYSDAKGTHSFTGDEISTQETGIGTMVTVTLKVIPDGYSTRLTLLVPSINLNGSKREFRTIVIKTTGQNSIGGPRLVTGAIESYKVIDLRGTADSVIS